MNDTVLYKCEICGKREKGISKTENLPICHGEAMKPVEPLPVCETTMTAEHARLYDMGDPCDDSRG